MWKNFNGPFFLLPIFVLWFAITLALKGYSLWHAVKRAEKWWFVALLVLNTAGLLELFYIIFILKKFPTRAKKSITKKLNNLPERSSFL